MHEIVVADTQFHLAETSRSLVVADEIISVDTESFDWDKKQSFSVSLDGKRIGAISYYPTTPDQHAFWAAHLHENYPFANEHCTGYGSTVTDAIHDALTKNVSDLRDAAASGVRIRNQLKKKSSHLTFRPQ